MIAQGSTLNIVRLGEHNQATTIDYDKYGNSTRTIDVPIEKMISHPKYEFGRSLHDIALIRLRNSIKFSDSIRPICLPPVIFQHKNYDSFPLTVVGWGESENGKINKKLKYLFTLFILCFLN